MQEGVLWEGVFFRQTRAVPRGDPGAPRALPRERPQGTRRVARPGVNPAELRMTTEEGLIPQRLADCQMGCEQTGC